MRQTAGVLLTATVFSALAPLAAHAEEPSSVRESIYTRHKYDRCPSRGAAEGGVTRRACLGVGSVEVFWTADDDSAAVWFGRRPLKESIDLGSFYEPGETIEWRLDKSTGRPVAAIVRYRVGQSVGALKESRVVIYRLEPSGASCVMAVIREPRASQKARDAVDAGAASFRCGSSRRRDG